MPQEAVFLPDGASFKENLDPLGVATLAECEDALRAVDMWNFVLERDGLNAGMAAGTLSAGQRQLLSLGRALVRRRVRERGASVGGGQEGGILLLDEVSANVDHAMERVMQEIIAREFRGYTVLAVSHRLEMIMDFGRVVVMDAGAVVEIGVPRELAGQEGSRFGELVRAGGM